MYAPSVAAPPVAIVGVGALLPGSLDPAEFWRTVVEGRDLISDVPPDRWRIEDHYDPDPSAPDKTYSRRGGFLMPVPFDPLAFGMPPSALAATDTAQLLSLIVARRTLRDHLAGRTDHHDGSRTSVILGSGSLDLMNHMAGRLGRPVWRAALIEHGMTPQEADAVCERISDSYVPWQESTFPGLLSNVIAGRVANKLDLHGTNFTTDAACASSLAAIRAAMDDLALGRSDLVLTGGVDTMNDITMFMCFSKTPALSRTGDCRPFSAAADGTLLGEGVVMFALKRLADAERDGDRVYAVIRGIGASSDGAGTAVYAPVPEGQAMALRRAYESAGYGPETVELVEAHGTGTPAGDLAELTALRRVFAGTGRNDPRWCALGSVKSQVGHAKSAAGAVGVLKAALALYNRVLPPMIKVGTPDPAHHLADSPFYLSTRLRPWIRGSDHPRRASVSSFGFGGTNFHVALEEHRASGPADPEQHIRLSPAELVLFAADSVAELSRLLAGGDEGDLDVTARRSQETFDPSAPVRAAVVAGTREELRTRLAEARRLLAQRPDVPSIGTPSLVFLARGRPDPGRIALLFPGQGAQYVGMGGDVATRIPVARQAWDRCADLTFDGTPVHRVVFPPPALTDEEAAAQQATLTATEWAQPALAATSLALLAVLDRLELPVDCLGGHSFGELVALHRAGAYDEPTLLSLARRRGEAMRDAAVVPGGMVAVAADRRTVEAALAPADGDLWIANHNTPEQVVVGGAVDALDRFRARLDQQGVRSQRLAVSAAFHTPLVAAASRELADHLRDQEIRGFTLPVYGNADGRPYPGDPAGLRSRVAEHLRSEVRFVDQIEAMYADGVRTFVEVGAGDTLTRMVGRILRGRRFVATSLDRRGRDGMTSLYAALAQLAVAGVPLAYPNLWRGVSERPADVPLSPATVLIDGGNVGRPYPPADSAPTVSAEPPQPAPADVAPAVAALRDGPEPGSPRPVRPAAAGRRTAAHTPYLRKEDATVDEPSVAPVDRSPGAERRSAPPVPAPALGPVGEMLRQFQQGLADAQALHEQLLVETHGAFLRTAFDGLAAVLDRIGPAAPAAGAFEQVTGDAPLTVGRPDRRTPDAVPVPRQVTAGPSVTPRDERPAAAPPVPPAPSPEVSVGSPADGSSVDVSSVVVEVVAERTGFPAEVLSGEMDLESDLGVDSIKRVEILSRVRSVLGAGEVSSDVLASVRTLADVAGVFGAGRAGDGSPVAVPLAAPVTSAEVSPVPSPEVSVASSVDGSPADGSSVDVSSVVVEVVAERTGFPAEVLSGEMDLESDLGVDSIKRVEILSRVRSVLGAGEVSSDVLASVRTLADVAGVFGAGRAGDGSRVAAPPGASVAATSSAPTATTATRSSAPSDVAGHDDGGDAASALRRLVPRLLPARAPGRPMVGLSTAEIGVSDGGSGLGRLVVDALNRHGLRARPVTSGPDLHDVDGLVVLDGLAPLDTPDAARTVLRNALSNCRDFGVGATPRLLVTVQDTGGDFGLSGREPARAWVGGLAALPRSLRTEWPSCATKAIDCERAGRADEAVAHAVVTELLEGGTAADVALAGDGGRAVFAMVETAPVAEPAARPDRPAGSPGVVLVTGGGRGITAASLPALCAAPGVRLLLLGRTELVEEPAAVRTATDRKGVMAVLAERAERPPTPDDLAQRADAVLATREVRETLGRLAEAGVEARYLAVDVRDREALSLALKQVRSTWGPIRGIVHGAGVRLDSRIGNKNAADVAAVFDTKVGGLQTLLECTGSDPIELLVLFSSVVSLRGNEGQSDYAMANEVLNHVGSAVARTRPECVVRSVAWGPWRAGMVTPELARRFQGLGFGLLAPDVAVGALGAELAVARPGSEARVLIEAAPAGGDGRRHAWQRDLTVRRHTHPHLLDHSIAGQPVLPLAVAAGWFADAARGGRPDRDVLVLERIRVLSKVALPGLDSGAHTLTLSGAPAGDRLDLMLTMDGIPRYSASARAGVPVAPGRVGPPPATGTARADRDVLFHTGSFQALGEVHELTEDSAAASVVGAVGLGWGVVSPYLDAGAVDGALQLALVWGRSTGVGDLLPMGVDEIRVHRITGAADYSCVLSRGRPTHAGATCDLTLFTADGAVHAELSGVELVARPA